MTRILAEALTTFEVSDDGARLQLNVEDAEGSPSCPSLPTHCLPQMVMSLPRMAQTALRRQHRDDNLRIVYPAADWVVEGGQGQTETFILTLKTTDGFEVSLALTRDGLEGLEQTLREAGDAARVTSRIN